MHQVCQIQTVQTWCAACHWLLGVVGGPAHGTELIVSSVRYRQPELAKVVQGVGQFRPKVLVNQVLRDVAKAQ